MCAGIYLENLYWAHVEHFPMHIGGLPKKSYDGLICIFNHGLAGEQRAVVVAQVTRDRHFTQTI